MMRILPWILIFSARILFAQSSVLSTGTWLRFGITETGIYKLDRNTLDASGFSGDLTSDNIQLYGNGVKGILPQSNALARPEDLTEVAIFLSDGNDNSFDQNDFILFYAVGPNLERWNEEGFNYEKNIYSDTAYYFLRVDGEGGKRIKTENSTVGVASTTITTFNDFIVFEEDVNKVIPSGRGWYGETMTSGEDLSFSHSIDGLSSDLQMTLSVVSRSSENATFNITANESPVGAINLNAVPDGPGTIYSLKARQASSTFDFSSSSNLDLEINFDGNASGERGFIDYYHLTFQRNLQLYANETDFRWIGNTGELLRYEVANASGATIWNVTDPTNVSNQHFETDGDVAVFQNIPSSVNEYVIFQGSDFSSPFIFGDLPNQNLRGATSFDAIIVTHQEFLNEAHELAQFHRDHDKMSVAVVTPRQIYNEFSSGRQDVSAIRDYAKYVYKEGGRLKYLLLFGDCSYDYKDRINRNTNFVPTYESRQSFHPIFSYSSDDYFGFFEEDEGDWVESDSGDHTLEIGLGRLPVKTIEEARIVVDKIIYYSTSPNTLGEWRSEITYVGDDGDGNIHARQIENFSEFVDTTYTQYNINKVLLDAFLQIASGSSERSPSASSDLKTRIKNGSFLVNFLGHGNERLWMEEEILTPSDIENLTNRNKLPIFVTATCEFGRYDDPIQVSGAERLLLSEQGGGIALLTTSRPVFASSNDSLNRAFHENVFRRESGQNLRLGDVIRYTKNEGLEGPVNRNFTLLGDPMMIPAYPKLDISVNELDHDIDTLSALEKVTFTGEIQENGVLRTDFNGRLIAGVFDVKQDFKTLGQESSPYTYTLRTNALFRGEASVEEGRFSFSFIVPKNISYQFKKGKISLYAWDENLNIDAGGSSREFIIGGTEQSPIEDNIAPSINAYMNDSSFVNGGSVGSSPLLIARVEDASGITTSRSGVVEGITLEFQGATFNLNEFYSSDVNDFTKGTIIYPLQDLDPGVYNVTLKVWDTYNNAIETSLEFRVVNKPKLFIYNPSVYPNPIEDEATFSFEHDREDEDLSITIIVYGSAGNVLSQIDYTMNGSQRSIEIPWKAQTDSGESLNQGIYYARTIIRSKLDGAIKEFNQKLVIVN